MAENKIISDGNLKNRYSKKKYYSTKKIFVPENNEFLKTPKYKSSKLVYQYVSNTENKNNDTKTINSDSEEFSTFFEYIKNLIENFIKKNNTNIKLIFSTIMKIKSFTNSLLNSLTKSSDIVILDKNLEESKNILENYKLKVSYEIKIDELNKKIKELYHEIELLNINEENKKNYKNFGIYNSLKRKIFELESKLKLEEFKYLLCIKEQQTKISELEKELKIKKIEVDFNDIKETRCFPHLTQYNYKEDINPKSIPLTKTFLKTISTERKRTKNKTQLRTTKKNSFFTITNSNTNTINNQIINNTNNNSRQNNLKTTYNKNNSPIKKYIIKNEEGVDTNRYGRNNINSEKVMIKSVDFLKKNNLVENEGNSNSSLKNRKLSQDNEDNDNINIKNLNDFNNNNIMNKDKKFFISHPNLTIAGVNNKKNKYVNGLPNKVFSFKFSKKLEKNAFFIFPSTLNETLVNLEKLRINKDYIDKKDVI